MRSRSRVAALRDAAGAAVGAVLGLAPHVLHHVGIIAGTALLTGAGGNSLLFAAGLALSVPMLRRLHRRFQTWLAPGIAIVVYAVMFSLSSFVIGPAISGDGGGVARPPAPSVPASSPSSPSTPSTPSAPPTTDHAGHHG